VSVFHGFASLSFLDLSRDYTSQSLLSSRRVAWSGLLVEENRLKIDSCISTLRFVIVIAMMIPVSCHQ
jgi:hypothetical protein